ncbi:hypothetical protein [Levilactobacillus namurensis]|uniref:hypothetical protein n=1 Tax=Levilactobacillus namurensis TaxID=380393 RepID=UPI0026EE9C67|nr:hypothetical protein [Levilactobacillus namurensis]
MKSGENKLIELIAQMITERVDGLKSVYTARVIATNPLTLQPSVLTPEGKKKVPVRGARQLDFTKFIVSQDGTPFKARPLKVDDDVLAIIISDSTAYYRKGGTYLQDNTRVNSVDSTIVVGVIK